MFSWLWGGSGSKQAAAPPITYVYGNKVYTKKDLDDLGDYPCPSYNEADSKNLTADDLRNAVVLPNETFCDAIYALKPAEDGEEQKEAGNEIASYFPLAKRSSRNFFTTTIDKQLLPSFVANVIDKEYGAGFHAFLLQTFQFKEVYYTGSAVWKYLMNRCLALWKQHENTTTDYPVGDIDIIVRKMLWDAPVHTHCQAILKELCKRFPEKELRMEFSMGVVTFHVRDSDITPLQLQFKPPSRKHTIERVVKGYDADHLKTAFDAKSGTLFMHARTPWCWLHGETYYNFSSTRTKFRAHRMRELGWKCLPAKHSARTAGALELTEKVHTKLLEYRNKELPILPLSFFSDQMTLFNFVGGKAYDFVLPFYNQGGNQMCNNVIDCDAIVYSNKDGVPQLSFQNVSSPQVNSWINGEGSCFHCPLVKRNGGKDKLELPGTILPVVVNNNLFVFFHAKQVFDYTDAVDGKPMEEEHWCLNPLKRSIRKHLKKNDYIDEATKAMVYYSKHQVFPRFQIKPIIQIKKIW